MMKCTWKFGACANQIIISDIYGIYSRKKGDITKLKYLFFHVGN